MATDPDRCGGTVRVVMQGEEVSSTVTDDPAWGRGVGVIDMVRAIAAGESHRASAELAYHVLDVMLTISEAMQVGEPMDVASSAPLVPLLPADWHPEHEGT